MIKSFLLVVYLTLSLGLQAQQVLQPGSEKIETTEAVYNRMLYTDAQVSTFLIEIKNEVKEHYHQFHTEQVYVLSGKAEMKMGDSNRWRTIKEGDLIIIPANTPHAVRVKGKQALRVLSIQAPNFDGNDRIWVEDGN
jgi:quercetin dioxygenase-like cupin family protein